MTKFLKKISLLAITVTGVAFASCRDDRPHITGNLVSLPDGYVWLYTYDGTFVKIDSALSRDGRFAFNQPEMLPNMVFVSPQSLPDILIPVLIDGHDVYISGNLNYKEDIRVTGTVANDQLREYVRSIRDTDIMARTIELEINDWTENGDPADSLKYRRLAVKRNRLREQISQSRAKFVRDNPASIVSAMFLNISLNDSMNHRQVDSLISQLDSAIVDNAFSERLHTRLSELSN